MCDTDTPECRRKTTWAGAFDIRVQEAATLDISLLTLKHVDGGWGKRWALLSANTQDRATQLVALAADPFR